MSTSDPGGVLPQLRLDELLGELQARLQAVLDTRDRMRGLLEAVVAISSGLELEAMLRRLVEAAVDLVDARYGALGVIGEGKQLAQFIPVGISEEDIARIHHWPEGRGSSACSSRTRTRCAWRRSPAIPSRPGSTDLASEQGTTLAVRMAMAHIGPAVVFPLRSLAGVRGVLIVGRRKGGPPFAPAATKADVTVAVDEGHLAITVSDNGRGIQPGTRRSGLSNMTERARALHGDLIVSPGASGGTELVWRVPVVTEPGQETLRPARRSGTR